MEFRDLKTQYNKISGKIDRAIKSAVESGRFIMGAEVSQLESELARYVGVKHAITCGNGTDALVLSLTAMGVKEGDAVFVPDFTFFASAESISAVGATPVFVDVESDSFNICPQALIEQIGRVKSEGRLNLKAVIAVDLFGLPANYDEITKITHENGILLLEDGAQGFGGSLRGRRACSFGDISATSFFPAKPLGCYGDGGAVFTDSDDFADLVRSLRVHGKGVDKYDNVRIGQNSRLDTVQAAVLLVKLEEFKSHELDDVNTVAEKYSQKLGGIVKTPVVKDGFYSSWAQYTIQLESRAERDELQAELKGRGIPSMVYYPKPMHKQTAFKCIESRDDDFTVSSRLCDTVLSLPMHPYMTDDDINEVVSAVKEQFKRQ